MPNCCVPNCKNSSENGYLLRCFPRNEVLRADWTRNINRPGFNPNHCHRICEIHFAPNMWEKTRVDGTRKLKYNAVPTIFEDYVLKETPVATILIPSVGKMAKNNTKIKKEKAIVKILPPANSKIGVKPIILPASIFENQLNPPSTIIVNTEGQIINPQTLPSGPQSTSILKPQVKSSTIPSTPMIISTNASSSILKSQIRSASNQSPLVISPSSSILKSQFQITAQQSPTQVTPSKSTTINKSVLIPLNSSVQKISAPNASKTKLPSIAIPIQPDSEPLSADDFSDVEMETLGMNTSKAQMKKVADERFEKMDKLLLKQLKLNNALRKKLASVTHQLHLKTKEKDKDFKEYLKDLFTDDQMRAIELRHTNPKSITAWSHRTMIKAIKLKECCGTRGYEELLRQNMPLPSIRTISRWCTQRNIAIP